MNKKIFTGKFCKICNTMLPAKKRDHVFCSPICRTKYNEHETESGNGKTRPRIKNFLIKTRGNKCEICGMGAIWNGKELILHLDHINGDADNNSINNVRLLCPNCHSQTETYCQRNRGKGKSKSRSSYLKKYRTAI